MVGKWDNARRERYLVDEVVVVSRPDAGLNAYASGSISVEIREWRQAWNCPVASRHESAPDLVDRTERADGRSVADAD